MSNQAVNIHKSIVGPTEVGKFSSGLPVSTGSSAHPEALAVSRLSASCCAGERQSSDWPMCAPHGGRTGGDPAWGADTGGTLLVRRVHGRVSNHKD